MKVARYNQGLAKIKFKGNRHRLYTCESNINGHRIYAEKHCVYINIPKDSKYAFGLSEGNYFGHEYLVLVSAKNVNPALFGRE